MFNETSGDPIGPSTCGPGQVPDFDPETGNWIPGCVDETDAYNAPTSTPGAVNVKPKAADSWTNAVIYGGLAVVALMVLTGGRR